MTTNGSLLEPFSGLAELIELAIEISIHDIEGVLGHLPKLKSLVRTRSGPREIFKYLIASDPYVCANWSAGFGPHSHTVLPGFYLDDLKLQTIASKAPQQENLKISFYKPPVERRSDAAAHFGH